MHKTLAALLLFAVLAGLLAGCSGSQPARDRTEQSQTEEKFVPNREAALSHYLNGGMLDQKEDYAAAILEYQDALRYDRDPAIYYSIAKDYAILGKQQLAIENGKEAVRLAPDNREYREALAEVYLRAFQFDDAVKQYYETIRIDSGYRQGWYGAGRILSLTKPSEAIAFFEKYLDYFGDDFDIYTQLVQIHGNLGNTEQVVAILQKMSLLEPGNFDVKKLLGDTYLQIDSVDKALEVYNELLAKQPGNNMLRASLAYGYLIKKDRNGAREQIEAVMRQDSVSTDDQVQFGQLIVSLVQRDSTVIPVARELFDTIRVRNPEDWRPYWFLGAIANLERNDTVAIGYFEQVTRLASWNVDGWVAVASIYYDTQRFEKAIAVLEEAKQKVEPEFRVYFILGISQQRLGRAEDAARSLVQAVQLNEKNVDALSALGLVYNELSRFEDSDSSYERALRLDPRNALVLNNYSYSLSERGIQLERALTMAEEAVRQAPDNESYLDTKGWIFFQLGRYEEAETLIKRAVDLGSKSAVIHEHLGDVYSKLHKKELAVEYWQKALDLGSSSPSLKEKIERGSL